jgi:hypothetical protein
MTKATLVLTRAILRHIPEGGIFNSHRRLNLKSCMPVPCFVNSSGAISNVIRARRLWRSHHQLLISLLLCNSLGNVESGISEVNTLESILLHFFFMESDFLHYLAVQFSLFNLLSTSYNETRRVREVGEPLSILILSAATRLTERGR